MDFTSLVGQTLAGKYTIQRELGRGGMAAVFLADQPGMKRKVAIKVLPRELLIDSSFVARFQREVETVAGLTHPHILTVHDHGEEQGWTYIVMAYLDGGSLSDRIQEFPEGMPFADLARLLRQVAEALDFAHSRGVIHRDLKPANILLDGSGNAYLADFGIATLTEASGQLTGSGIIGTPAYLAPEMTQPNSTSPKLDIYALGVTLFECLTGQAPFDADTPIGLIMAHVRDPIPQIRTLRPDAPEGLQFVLNRALAKDPAQRYEKATDLLRDFEAALRGDLDFDTSFSTQPLPGTLIDEAAPATQGARSTRQGLDAGDSRTRAGEPAPVSGPANRGLNPLLLIGGGLGLLIILGLCAIAAVLIISQGGAAQSAQATADAVIAAGTAAAQSTLDAQASATTAAELAPAETAAALAIRSEEALAWPVFFSDDFSTGAGNWFQEPNYVSDFADASIFIENGVYSFKLTGNTEQGVVWYEPHGNTFLDTYFVVTLLARRSEGQPEAFYGISFYYRDNTNLYFFAICDQGCVNVSRVEDGVFHTLYEGRTTANRPAGEFNELRVIGTEGFFSFYVNGVEVGHVFDDELDFGGVGVYTEVFHQGENATFEFDSIEVLAPAE